MFYTMLCNTLMKTIKYKMTDGRAGLYQLYNNILQYFTVNATDYRCTKLVDYNYGNGTENENTISYHKR